MALASAGLVLAAAAGISSNAWFTAEDSVALGTFSTGTLEIAVEPAPSHPGGPPWKWGHRPGHPQGPPHDTPDLLVPGATITFMLRARSTGTLPLDYTVEPVLSGDLALGTQPCYVSEVRVDGVRTLQDSLSAAGGPDEEDLIEIDVTMPWEAGSEYQGQSGELVVTVNATQQH